MEHRLRVEGNTGLDAEELPTTPSRTIFPFTILIMVVLWCVAVAGV